MTYVPTGLVKYVETLRGNPVAGENIVPSANKRNNARADIRATAFWGHQQCTFFDVIGLFTQTHRAIVTPVSQAYTDVMSRQRRENMGTK